MKPYTKAVDMWSIGVITYCMLSGITPFGISSMIFILPWLEMILMALIDGEDDAELQQSILDHDLEFFSPEWDEISMDAKVLPSLKVFLLSLIVKCRSLSCAASTPTPTNALQQPKPSTILGFRSTPLQPRIGKRVNRVTRPRVHHGRGRSQRSNL